MQKYNTTTSELSIDFKYPDINDPLFSDLRNNVKIDLKTDAGDLDKVKIISGFVHNLFTHNGDSKPSSLNPLTILKEARQGKSFRCVEYSLLTTALLWAYEIPARIVGLKTSDVGIREFGAGHVVVEFWSTEFQKWIMIDVQAGIIPKYKDVYLSAFELREETEQNSILEYIPINNSRFSKTDSEKYTEWIRQYLYFFDTPLETTFSQTYTEENRLAEEKLILIPLGVEPPKVFQKVIPINAVYTHSVLDFYQKIN